MICLIFSLERRPRIAFGDDHPVPPDSSGCNAPTIIPIRVQEETQSGRSFCCGQGAKEAQIQKDLQRVNEEARIKKQTKESPLEREMRLSAGSETIPEVVASHSQ